MRTTTCNGRLLTLALAMGMLGVLSCFPGPLHGQAKPAKASGAPQATPNTPALPKQGPYLAPAAVKKYHYKKSPSTSLPNLAQMLDAALRHNPDIRVAESHRIEAEAELNRVRLEIAQKVMRFNHSWQAQRQVVSISKMRSRHQMREFERMKQLIEEDDDEDEDQKMILEHELGEARLNIEEGKINQVLERARLAEIEAELPYLLGRQPDAASMPHKPYPTTSVDPAPRGGTRRAQPRLPQPGNPIQPRASLSFLSSKVETIEDKIRKALGSPTQLEFSKASLKDVIAYLNHLHGLEFLVDEAAFKDEGKNVHDLRISILMGGIPLAAALQAIEDKLPGIRFVVRDYGTLVTLKGHEPHDRFLVREFWKGRSVGRRGGFRGGRLGRPSGGIGGLIPVPARTRGVAPTVPAANVKKSSR